MNIHAEIVNAYAAGKSLDGFLDKCGALAACREASKQQIRQRWRKPSGRSIQGAQ